MPDAVTSDQGMKSLVDDQLKAKDMEFRMAGDQLFNISSVMSAEKDAEAQIKAAKIRKEQAEKSQKQESGGLGGIGKIAGGILGSVVGGPVGGAIGSGLGGAVGGLFG